MTSARATVSGFLVVAALSAAAWSASVLFPVFSMVAPVLAASAPVTAAVDGLAPARPASARRPWHRPLVSQAPSSTPGADSARRGPGDTASSAIHAAVSP
jgi:hypothetical protein